MKNHNNDDKYLNKFLYGKSELANVYRGTTDTKAEIDAELPGLELDNIILAAAKGEISPKLRKKSSPFSSNYIMPFSIAASIVIVVAMVSLFPEVEKTNRKPYSVSVPLSDNDSELDNAVFAEEEIPVEAKEKRKLAKQKIEKSRTEKLVAKSDLVSESVENKPIVPVAPAKQTKIETKKITKPAIVQNKPDSKAGKSVTIKKGFLEPRAKSAPAPVTTALIINYEYIYNELTWEDFSSYEWRRRIKEIYYLRGENDAKEVIVHYNKKFPESKLDIRDITGNSSR